MMNAKTAAAAALDDDLMIPGARGVGNGGGVSIVTTLPTPSVPPLRAVPPARPVVKPRTRWSALDRKVMGMHLREATLPSALSPRVAPARPWLPRSYRWLLLTTLYLLMALACVRVITWASRQAVLG